LPGYEITWVSGVFDILMSAAAQVDHQNILGSNQWQSKHVVNYLDLTPEEYSDLSSPLDQLSIHQTQAREPDQKPKAAPDPASLYVPYAVWEQLPPHVQALIWEACGKQPSGGNKARLAKFHDVYAATSDDLAHDVEEDQIVTSDVIQDKDTPSDSNDSQKIAAHLTNHHVLEPNDIWHVLATSQKCQEKEITQHAAKKTIVVDGVTYTANVHNVVYNVSEHHANKQETSLVDRGANGGMAGEDVMVVERGEWCADVNGIDGHEVQNLPICTVAATVKSNKGPIIVIMHQYAYLGKGKTIHSSGQMEYYKNNVDDKSSKVGGK